MLKMKLSNKKLIAGGIAFVAIIVMLIAIMLNQPKVKNKRNGVVADSELARAMTYDPFNDGDDSIEGTNNVKFSAFFLRDVNNDGYAEKIKGTCKQIGKEDTLYMELNVLTDGYLENGVITVNSDNFYLQTAIPKDGEVKDNVISNNTKQIALNQINNGTQKLLTGIVRSGDYSYDSQKYSAIGNDPSKYSKVNSITLTGTYVASDGTRTEINKNVDLNMDWYGVTKAEIPNYIGEDKNLNQSKNNTNVVDDEKQQAVFDFDIGIQETSKELILSKAYLEGTIPQLNGYNPVNVEIINKDVEFTYDSDTKKFIATKEAKLNDDGTIKNQCYDSSYNFVRYNKFQLRVSYPLDAYNATGADTVELKIPVQGYYEGCNNPNSEFNNPYKSNVTTGTIVLTFSNPEGDVAIFKVKVGKYMGAPKYSYVVSKKNPLKIYNGVSSEENNDTYVVNWHGETGKNGNTNGMIMKETKDGENQISDEFIKSDSTTDSMESLVSNIGIYFSNAEYCLGSDGWIKVYDDTTGVLLHEFNKNDWSDYSEGNPYKYDLPVKHIKIVTSETKASSSIDAYNVKKLDDEYITTNYEREQFDNLKYIKSTVTGYVNDSYINTDTQNALYESPYSMATLVLSKDAISTQETEKNMQIKIEALGNEKNNQDKWLNGAFLIKLPKDIIDIDISSVNSSDSKVTIDSYEIYENNGERFIKINTSNDEATDYILTVNCNITSDPRKETATEYFELYASNENAIDYLNTSEDIYDVNDNLNTIEMVNKYVKAISLISPNSLLTNQMATNYDDEGSVAIAPQIAVVNKERRSATVNVEVNNNYSSTISEVKILGRIPFEGNKYTINGSDMGSTFTATMTEDGIKIPEDLQVDVKVYYTENGEASNDLSNEENGWTQTPTDYSKVKSYLIDFGNYQLAKGEKQVITYDINIPQGLEYNDVAYGHHAVYFSLDTTEGKYRTQTEPNKVGFMIAKKYDLELTKYQKNKDNIVSGATYAIYEDGNEEKRTRVTRNDGKLSLTGLYIGKTYVVIEIKSPSEYELNEEVVKFTTSENDGKISVEKIEGNVKNIQAVQPNENDGYKVQIEVEDEVKARLKIIKTEKDTENKVGKVRYKLTGTGISSAGRIISTNTSGEVTTVGLKIGGEYTLEEVKADGYYVEKNPVKFTVTNTDGTYEINVSEGTAKESTITEENNIPTAVLKLEDEKIPTYDLEISKIKRITDTAVTEDELKAKAEQALASADTVYLSGAKFKLYKGDKELGEYTTDANGKITITGLYQYIDGKDEEGEYSLKEVIAPEGYSKAKDITFKVDGSTGELRLVNTNGENEPYTVDGNTLKLIMEDSPSFKLIKKDSETQETLANVKFAIYNIDDNSQKPATNSKGEILGTKEMVNGKEYYTVSTDEKGELTADLPQGLYKAVELQAPDKYDLTDSIYYFGIGASRTEKTGMKSVWAKGIGGSGNDQLESVIETSDGGYIVGGYFNSPVIELDENISITNKGSYDGMLIKYSASGECEWAKVVGGISEDKILSVIETSDRGYIAVGKISSNIVLENGVILSGSGGMIIKYSESGECEWAKVIGNKSDDQINKVTECSDGGIVVVGCFSDSNVDLGSGIGLTNKGSSDGMIIKYTADGDIQWAKAIGGNGYDNISSVIETGDGGIVIGENFSSGSIDLENGESLSNKGSVDGMIIKYNAKGVIEWANQIGGNQIDTITAIVETSDEGIIVSGFFESTNIELGNGINLMHKGNGYTDNGMLIKYSKTGEAEFGQSIVSGSTFGNVYIKSLAKCDDGGIIAGGYFDGFIEFGNGIGLAGHDMFNEDGMIIKYSIDGKVEWAKQIVGAPESDDRLSSVVEINDGVIVVAGYFHSPKIDLGNGEELTNKGENDGIITRIEKAELSNPVTIQKTHIGGNLNEKVNSVANTSDGGYVVGGYFESENMDLGDETNKESSIGMVIKYNASGNYEWKKEIGANGDNVILAVTETSDGGIIAGGYFSDNVNLENGISFTSKGLSDGILIKYNAIGECEWARDIGGSSEDKIKLLAESIDGGIIVGGEFKSDNIDLGNEVNLINKGESDGMVIKYNATGECEWARVIGGNENEYITSVSKTLDGGIIIGGEFKSSIIELENGVSLNKNSESRYDTDGMIIKYNSSGKCEWIKHIGSLFGDTIDSVLGTSDGGIIVVGNMGAKELELDDGVKLSQGRFIIKYDTNGKFEWIKKLNSDLIVNSVVETSDKGYILVGRTGMYVLNLEPGECLDINNGGNDGIVIKYNVNGEYEWAKAIGGTKDDILTSVAETKDENIVVGGYFESDSIELENGVSLTNNGLSDGMVLKISNREVVNENQELQITNIRKKFKITTDVQEIDGIKGGSISGEDKQPYETVKYGDSSEKEIKMIPDENYEIIKITVNDQEYPFTSNEDGTYTMPAFTNMIEDKNVVVTYALKDNKVIINKVDSKTKEKIQGAEFKLDQIEERAEPKNVLGNLTDNGQVYSKVNLINEITGKCTDMFSRGQYYFIKYSDGTYIPMNGKTFQLATGKTSGISNSTANSMVVVNLQDEVGQYVIEVNAQISSETNYDIGYAILSESSDVPAYNNEEGRFIYISGEKSAQNYQSAILEGGHQYFVHFGYRKDGSTDKNDDQMVINSIKLYSVNATSNAYNFVNYNGQYESTNQGMDNTVANSYIPIDLTTCTGKYNLTVNAEVSSESNCDYGYATITQNTTRPAYNNSTGRFIYISGTENAKDYTTVLQGGKKYYLHFGYYKNGSISSGADRFDINSVNIALNDSELYHTTVKTNSEGQAITQIPFGKYRVTETKAPDGYWLNEEPTEIEFRSGDDAVHEFTIEDVAKSKLIVHHYIKGTTTKLADDEVSEARAGDSYSTKPKLDLGDYELEMDESGNLVLPDNAVGTYGDGTTEVTYYYVEKQIPLTVHHYIEGTSSQVPLKAGGTASDEFGKGKKGDSYTTSAVADDVLSDEYELASVPSNANGSYEGNEVVVIYYYKKVARRVVVQKYQEDGKTPLQGAKFTIDGKEYVTDGLGKIETTLTPGVYEITEIEAPYGYKLPDNPTTEITITKETPETVNITNEKKTGTVIVHHYVENSTTKIKLKDGSVAEDEVKSGVIGDIYATKQADTYYELIAEPDNSSGKYVDGTIVVTYYYRPVPTSVLVHHYIEGTTTKVAEDVTINGMNGDEYSTSVADVESKYELVAEPENKNGRMTEDTIEVIYYYRVRDAVVNVRYLEKGTDNVLAEPTQQQGKVDEDYHTVPKDIDGYKLVEHIGNENGKYEIDSITITYYYLYKTKATVQYIDKMTGKILEQSTTEGLVGDDFVTESKNFENYILIEEPAEKTVKMTKEEQFLKYYYIHISGGVIEKHIDEVSGEILANQVHTGNEGDEYDIPSRTFDGYDLVEDKLPTNAKGKMTPDPIEVIYYYKHQAKVTAEYIDKVTGDKLTEDVVQNGHEKDKYTTDRKKFDDYKLVEVPENADGEMTKDDIVVKYYYVHVSGGVIVNHVDVKTGKQLLDERKQEGYEGDPYETHEENIPDYELVKDMYPENAKGTMTIEPTRVTYYYIKKTGVRVKYVDEATGEEIDETLIIPGKSGDEYTTDSKDFDGYDLVKEPENKNGTMEDDFIDVIYYYRRPAKVVVNYYDEATNEKLADEIEIKGHQGDEYTTDNKDIKYYLLTKMPDNKDGNMTVKVTKDENGNEIVEDTTYVNYYYRKLVFNMKVDKMITSVIVNGQEQAINGDLGKVEIARKDLASANVQVKYKITVKNDSELTGKAVVVENIPAGMVMKAENNAGWSVKNSTATRETGDLKPGETQEYVVTLDWNNGENNIGMKENTATITTQNEAGFEEKDTTDNEDKADIIVAIGTGEVPYVLIATGVLIVMLAVACGVYIVRHVGVEK